MTLHISEIGVRLAVAAHSAPGTPAAATQRAQDTQGLPAAMPAQGMEELVENCVRRVLDRLRALEER